MNLLQLVNEGECTVTDDQNPTRSSTPLPSSIGVCWMADDGTITLRLGAELPNGFVGHAMAEYPPQHREYAKILKHVGPLKPGGSKSVRPWPD